jgi:CxxC-x17-CxxC domain-containing protein
MGIVYRAWDPAVKRDVAIKVLTETNPEMLGRFRGEASAGFLKHENIVTVYEFVDHQSEPYLVMELLNGRSLRKVLTEGPKLSMLDKVQILQASARGLLHAHRHNVIHRDIKPANVMLLSTGSVKVLDFGIAKILDRNATAYTKANMIVGTEKYIAPELHLDQEKASAVSDIFSFGVLSYELLAEKHPLQTVYEPLRNVVPECSEALQLIVRRAMSPQPSGRYQSLQNLLDELALVEEALRKSQAEETAAKAQRAFKAGDVDAAEALARRVLDLEPTHSGGQELLRSIRRRRERPPLEARWKAAVQDAGTMLGCNRFEEAIEMLETLRDGLVLESVADLRTDVEARLSGTREAQKRAKQIAQSLAEARGAAGRRDLSAVSRSAAAVLALDPRNPEAVAFEKQVVEELSNARLRVKEHLAELRFGAAERLIENALRSCPGHPDLIALQSFVESTADAARKLVAGALREEEKRRARVVPSAPERRGPDPRMPAPADPAPLPRDVEAVKVEMGKFIQYAKDCFVALGRVPDEAGNKIRELDRLWARIGRQTDAVAARAEYKALAESVAHLALRATDDYFSEHREGNTEVEAALGSLLDVAGYSYLAPGLSRASRPVAPSPRPDPAPSSPLSPYLREPLEPRPQTPYYSREPQEPRPQPSYTKEPPSPSGKEPVEPNPPVRLGTRSKIPPLRPGSGPDPPAAGLTTCSQCGRETTVPFKPTKGRPVYCRECFLSRKVSSAASVRGTPPAQSPDELLEAYHVARTSSDRNARDQFDSRYPYVRVAWINHEEWQFRKNIVLRFQVSDFGWYLMVSRGGGGYYALPWFTQNLAHERESFTGVFQYPEGTGDTRLRLVRPALLQSEGEGWVLTAPGEVQADV